MGTVFGTSLGAFLGKAGPRTGDIIADDDGAEPAVLTLSGTAGAASESTPGDLYGIARGILAVLTGRDAARATAAAGPASLATRSSGSSRHSVSGRSSGR